METVAIYSGPGYNNEEHAFHDSEGYELNPRELLRLEDWFHGFVSDYLSGEHGDRTALEMKKEHSWRVADNMRTLAIGGSLLWADPILARAIGVLHDTGRFPQYREHGTFSDSESVSHGRLGSRVLIERGVLDRLDLHDREIIISAVKYHGTFRLPVIEEQPLRYVKLIRDADKLDAWRVLADHYSRREDERLEGVGQGLGESPGVSHFSIACLREGRVAHHARARNSNDMRIHYISWVYDMNYPASCRLALEAGDLRRIASGLPDEQGVRDAVEKAFKDLREKAERPE